MLVWSSAIGIVTANADQLPIQRSERFIAPKNSAQVNGTVVPFGQIDNGIYEFRGSLHVTAIDSAYTSNCSNAGYGVGSWSYARFSPNGVGGNGSFWKLALHSDKWAESYIFSGRPSSSLTLVASAYWVGRGGGGFYVKPKIAITTTNPATITTTTKSVYIEGKIWNPGDWARDSSGSDACQITFRFSGSLVP